MIGRFFLAAIDTTLRIHDLKVAFYLEGAIVVNCNFCFGHEVDLLSGVQCSELRSNLNASDQGDLFVIQALETSVLTEFAISF